MKVFTKLELLRTILIQYVQYIRYKYKQVQQRLRKIGIGETNIISTIRGRGKSLPACVNDRDAITNYISKYYLYILFSILPLIDEEEKLACERLKSVSV